MKSQLGAETADTVDIGGRAKLDPLAEFAVILLLVALACFLISS